MKVDRKEREALIDSLEVGDLIRVNNLTRVVRGLRHKRTRVMSVTFSIQRCSWTRRPYTVVNRADLYLCRLEVIRKGFGTVHGPLEKLLQQEVEDHNLKLLKCCDVIGVVL